MMSRSQTSAGPNAAWIRVPERASLRTYDAADRLRLGRLTAIRKPRSDERQESDDLRLFDLGLLRTRSRNENEVAIRRLCNTVHVSGDAVLCRALGRYK